ncbi:MAG: TolC family protein [Flavobacteriales bacterium]|nr:TolC family protein [Flavobacteriales bacterium]
MTHRILSVLFLAFAGQMIGQTAYSFSLPEAQAHAIQHSYDVQNARFDAEKARRQVQETISIGLPQVSGSIDYQNFIDIPTQVAPADAFGFPPYLNEFLVGVSQETGVPINAPEQDPNAISELQFGAPQTMTAGVSVSQLIFDGSYFVGLQASEAYAKLMEGAIRKSEQEVKDQTAQTYYGVLVADENVDVLEQSVDLMIKTVDETKKLYASGFMEEQDVDQLQLTLTDLQNRLSYAQQQRDLALLMLKFNLGLSMDASVVLTDTVESLLAAEGETLQAAVFSPTTSVDYKNQEEYLTLMNLNHKNEKVKGLPSIGAFYNYQRNAQRDKFNFLDFDEKWYPIQIWGVQMNVPIWTSFQGKHRAEQARVDVERAEMQLEQVKSGLEMEYQSAVAEYTFAQKNYDTQKASMELAQRIFDTTQKKYQQGVSSSMDLTQAENQLLTTHGNFINATLQLLTSRSRLNKALGRY